MKPLSLLLFVALCGGCGDARAPSPCAAMLSDLEDAQRVPGGQCVVGSSVDRDCLRALAWDEYSTLPLDDRDAYEKLASCMHYQQPTAEVGVTWQTSPKMQQVAQIVCAEHYRACVAPSSD